MANIARAALKSLLKTNSGSAILFTRSITSKSLRDQDPDLKKKPKPWDYKNKSFNLLKYYFDKTTKRFDENSKIVVVEGPVAAGKSAFAKELAKELDMLYLPEANLDMIMINSYGFNLKSLDEQLPESCRSHDIKDFLLNPKHQNTLSFQIRQYNVRFMQYIDALAHVFSTGQGVVLDRCCYSDFVFAEAMFSQGYISKLGRNTYYEFRNNTLQELLRPHLVIYLDVPVAKVQENIKKRGIACEIKSAALTPGYLQTMEKYYKQHYLKDISTHAELLVYDWTEPGEVETIVEDIEQIDFNRFDSHSPKMKDWAFQLEEQYAWMRNKFADRKQYIMGYFNIPTFNVPEMVIEADDAKIYHDTINNAPGNVYEQGYNSALGDTGIMFKMKLPHRDTLPLTERKLT